MVTVTTPAGTDQVNGTSWNIGYCRELNITDDQGNSVVSYADGQYLKVAQDGAFVTAAAS